MRASANKQQRTCIVCGQHFSKGAMLRIVRSPFDVVSFDRDGRAPGRGAYVCSAECFSVACKTKKFDRALKRALSPSEYELIADDITAAIGEVKAK